MGHPPDPNCRMLVPKKDRLIVYRNLFQEGVMVAKKDCNKAKHDDSDLPVKNIYVIKLLTSRGVERGEGRSGGKGGSWGDGGKGGDGGYRRGPFGDKPEGGFGKGGFGRGGGAPSGQTGF